MRPEAITSETVAAAYDNGTQVEAWHVWSLTTNDDDVTFGSNEFSGQDVGNRRTVRKTVGATGVGTHVSTDRACRLAGGIWRKVQSDGGEFIREVEIDNTGANPHRSAYQVNFSDARESREYNKDAWGGRYGSASEARAGTARHDGHSMVVGQSDYRCDLLSGLRQDSGDDVSRDNT
jgi:hypothetical protein